MHTMTIPRKVRTVVIPLVIIGSLVGVGFYTVLSLDQGKTIGLTQALVALAQVFVGIAVAIISMAGASSFLLEQNRNTIIQ
jgi:hypothetical protein